MKRFKLGNYVRHPTHIIIDEVNGELSNSEVVDVLNELADENNDLLNDAEEEIEHLQNVISIYEAFLEVNNLEIDWGEFCTVDECVKPVDEEYSCRDCFCLGSYGSWSYNG